MSKQQLKQAGFTIIEVVLVLAIAALIFLMVFIALPALQRSQRDDARKKDVTTVSGAVASWQGNNRATTAWPSDDQIKQYVTEVSGNTDTTKLSVKTGQSAGEVNTADATITVYAGMVCDVVSPGKVTLKKGTARSYATVTQLESGNNTGFCLDA